MRTLLGQFWRGWQRAARRLGAWQSRIVLTILYVVLIGPLTLIVRRKDPLGLRGRLFWQPYRGRSADLPATRSQ
ncbi:MAG TPA: hypothetical protein VKJ47_06470 [Candidatus Binatia bacterium]|nr:hypothetical protein [Candidatus Binatia bacterium]